MTRRRLAYSVGFTLPAHTPDLLEHIDEAQAWTPAYDTDTDGIREGAWVAELTGLLDLSGWPAGMRVIVRKERPHPGAQLRMGPLKVWLTSGVYAASLAVGFMMSSNSTGVSFPSLR